MVWPWQLMIILTTILSLFSDWRSHKASQTRPKWPLICSEQSFVLPSLGSDLRSTWAGWLQPIWWNRMRKVDHVTPANQTFPLYSPEQRSTFCTWNSWSSSPPNLFPRPQVTKDCCRSAGTPSLSPRSELLQRQGDKNYYHCIIERISRHIVSCGD